MSVIPYLHRTTASKLLRWPDERDGEMPGQLSLTGDEG
jgi:hypothetical protein